MTILHLTCILCSIVYMCLLHRTGMCISPHTSPILRSTMRWDLIFWIPGMKHADWRSYSQYHLVTCIHFETAFALHKHSNRSFTSKDLRWGFMDWTFHSRSVLDLGSLEAKSALQPDVHSHQREFWQGTGKIFFYHLYTSLKTQYHSNSKALGFCKALRYYFDYKRCSANRN